MTIRHGGDVSCEIKVSSLKYGIFSGFLCNHNVTFCAMSHYAQATANAKRPSKGGSRILDEIRSSSTLTFSPGSWGSDGLRQCQQDFY